jgi:hypothetical protein
MSAPNIRDDRRVRNRYFYSLPLSLIRAIGSFDIVGQLDSDAWEFERRVATEVESHAGWIGLSSQLGITDPYLKYSLPSEPDPNLSELVRQWRDQGHRCEGLEDLRTGKADVEPQRINRAQTAYAGWLFTNRQFVDEFRSLKRDHGLFLRPELPIRPVYLGQADPRTLGLQGAVDPVTDAVRAFVLRWRLLTIIGPRTVLVPGPQTQHLFPPLGADPSETRVNASHPDILPLPGRDELRQQLESQRLESIRDEEHLRQWADLVEAETLGRRRLDSLCLWYRLQHYLRVFHERHGDRLYRNQAAVQNAFAAFLGCSDSTIRRATDAITERLGPRWWLPDQASPPST